MLDVEDWAEIRRLHVGEGMPIKADRAASGDLEEHGEGEAPDLTAAVTGIPVGHSGPQPDIDLWQHNAALLLTGRGSRPLPSSSTAAKYSNSAAAPRVPPKYGCISPRVVEA